MKGPDLAMLGIIWGLTMAVYAFLSWRHGYIYVNVYFSRDKQPVAFKALVGGFALTGLVLIVVCSVVIAIHE